MNTFPIVSVAIILLVCSKQFHSFTSISHYPLGLITMCCNIRKQLLLLVLNLIFIQNVCCSKVYYITIYPSIDCPNEVEECHLSLSTLATNTSTLLDPNTTLIFLAGDHSVVLDTDLTVTNTDFLKLTSDNALATRTSIICNGGAHLRFINITHLQIIELEFIGCIIKVDCVDKFILKDSSIYGANSSSALHLTLTNATVVKCSFASNIVGTQQFQVGFLEHSTILHPQFIYQSRGARIGGALVLTQSNLTVSETHFEDNVAEVGGAISPICKVVLL